MKYAIFAVVSIAAVMAEYLYCAYIGVFSTRLKIKTSEKYKSYECVPYEGIKLITLSIICIAISFLLQMFLYSHTSVLNVIKLYGLFLLVFAAAVIDSKKKIIPNVLIISGLVFRLCVYIAELFFSDNIKEIVTNDLIGLAIGFGSLALVSIITKQGIGFGDAKLFAIIGITAGSVCTFSTLFISLVVSAVASIVFLAAHKKNRKGSFPFGPCVAVGYTASLFLINF